MEKVRVVGARVIHIGHRATFGTITGCFIPWHNYSGVQPTVSQVNLNPCHSTLPPNKPQIVNIIHCLFLGTFWPCKFLKVPMEEFQQMDVNFFYELK
jgi:hypothetical protein